MSGGWREDVRQAAAALRREPRWTATVVGVLALGAGAVAAAGRLGGVASVVPFRVTSALEPVAGGTPGWGLPWSAEAVFPAEIRAAHLDELATALWVTALLSLAAGCTAAWILVRARARARRRELGVRAAVGATGRRLAGQLAAEGVLLAAAGVGGGATAGRALGRLLAASPPEGLAAGGAGDSVWLVAAAVAAAGTVWTSWRPARRRGPVRGAGLAAPGGLLAGGRRGMGDLLAGGTVALSLPLLVGAGLAVASFAPGSSGDAAAGTKDTVLLRVRLDGTTSSPQERADRLETVLRGVRSDPGVTAGSLSTPGAWSGMAVADRVLAECRCARGGMSVPFVSPVVRHAAVSPGFFRTLGVDVLDGSGFGPPRGGDGWDAGAGGRSPGAGSGVGAGPGLTAAGAGAPPPVVVSRAYDRRTLRGARAVGKAVRVMGRVRSGVWHRVRGVVGDLAAGGLGVDRPAPTVYLPLQRHPPREADLLVRGPGGTGRVAERARAAAMAAVPGIDVRVQGSLAEEAARLSAPLDGARRLFGPAAALAFLVVAAGVFGATGDEMRRRSSEMALRRAVGARRRDVRAIGLGWAVRVCGRGVAAGLVLAAPMAVAIRFLLPGVRVAHPAVWGAATAAVLVAGVAGAAGPVRRTLRADPARDLGLW